MNKPLPMKQAVLYTGPVAGLMAFIAAPSLDTFNRAFTPKPDADDDRPDSRD